MKGLLFGDNPPKDHHPSKKCHRIVADAIIKKINLDLGNVEK